MTQLPLPVTPGEYIIARAFAGEVSKLPGVTVGPVTAELVITVHGDPQPAGSKSTFAIARKGADGQKHYTGKVGVRDGKTKASAERHKSWRAMVTEQALQAIGMGWARLECPIEIWVTYSLERPASHYGTGRNSGLLKPSAPRFPAVKPDGPKYDRSVHDSLTDAGVYKDDAQIVDWHGSKRYAMGPASRTERDVLGTPGVVIRIRQLA